MMNIMLGENALNDDNFRYLPYFTFDNAAVQWV